LESQAGEQRRTAGNRRATVFATRSRTKRSNIERHEEVKKTTAPTKRTTGKKIRQRQRQRGRETERQRDRETERQRDRETERQKNRETETERELS
jgi:zinc finger CCCH domain-containing protein 13